MKNIYGIILAVLLGFSLLSQSFANSNEILLTSVEHQEVLQFANGDKYVGSAINGVANGNGIYYYANGDALAGTFINGIINGSGIFAIQSMGMNYEGNFVNGVASGYGVLSFINKNEKYEGEFNNNTMAGKGKYYFSDGSYYEGNFINGVPNGKGFYCSPSGKIISEGVFY